MCSCLEMSQQFERATGRSKTQCMLYLINAKAMRRKRKKKFLLSLQLTNLSLNTDSSCSMQEEGTLRIALF